MSKFKDSARHNTKPIADLHTGMRAMKTIKIVVTDEDGVVLDRAEVEVARDCTKIAYRPIEGTLAERPAEETLEIGLGR